jgi:hypothetical protein
MAATTTELWPSITNTVMAPWRHMTSLPARRQVPSKETVKENKVAEPHQVSCSSVVLKHHTDPDRRQPNFGCPNSFKRLTWPPSLVHDFLR